jgi:hypothetical protein
VREERGALGVVRPVWVDWGGRVGERGAEVCGAVLLRGYPKCGGELAVESFTNPLVKPDVNGMLNVAKNSINNMI